MDRRVLGRGLDALISTRPKSEDKEVIERLDVDSIKPNRYQPREDFKKEKLEELISSIKEKGVVQPILVRPSDTGYELIAGERRLRASKSLGYKKIPAVIRDVDDLNAMELSLIENLQREELNPMEESQAYQRLIEDFNFTQEMIGKAVGKDRATVANSLRLLTLPKKIREYLTQDGLTVGHAKVILSVEGESKRLELAGKVVKGGLSVRALEAAIKKTGTTKKKNRIVDNDTRMVEEMLQEKLGTKVTINRGKKRGTVQIEYYSEEDLNRILKVLGCF